MCKLLKVLSNVLRKIATIIRKRSPDGDYHDRVCRNKGAKKPRLEFDDFIEDASLQCDMALLLPMKEQDTGLKYCNEAVAYSSSGPSAALRLGALNTDRLSPPATCVEAENVCRIPSSLEEFSRATSHRKYGNSPIYPFVGNQLMHTPNSAVTN